MESYMKRALTLAQQGQGHVHPNPMVGAVIVKEGRVIGEGYHEVFGGPHAEIQAFARAQEDLQGATMYVTLEPCSHHGKTPPCADAIIDKGIKEVHVASVDPNPLVAGQGIQRLREAGITVVLGEEDEAQWALNKVFKTYITHKRPYVTLKTAMTTDGKIAHASGQSQWITNDASRGSVHRTRAQVRGILIGRQTAQHDDPSLTVRLKDDHGHHPTRIVLDTHATLPTSLKLFQTAREVPTLLAVSEHTPSTRYAPFQALGVQVILVPEREGHIDVKELLALLAVQGLDHILVEAGSALAWSFFQANLVDEYHLYIGPKVLGGAASLTAVGGAGFPSLEHARQLKLSTIQRFEDDVFIVYTRQEE